MAPGFAIYIYRRIQASGSLVVEMGSFFRLPEQRSAGMAENPKRTGEKRQRVKPPTAESKLFDVVAAVT